MHKQHRLASSHHLQDPPLQTPHNSHNSDHDKKRAPVKPDDRLKSIKQSTQRRDEDQGTCDHEEPALEKSSVGHPGPTQQPNEIDADAEPKQGMTTIHGC